MVTGACLPPGERTPLRASGCRAEAGQQVTGCALHGPRPEDRGRAVGRRPGSSLVGPLARDLCRCSSPVCARCRRRICGPSVIFPRRSASACTASRTCSTGVISAQIGVHLYPKNPINTVLLVIWPICERGSSPSLSVLPAVLTVQGVSTRTTHESRFRLRYRVPGRVSNVGLRPHPSRSWPPGFCSCFFLRVAQFGDQRANDDSVDRCPRRLGSRLRRYSSTSPPCVSHPSSIRGCGAMLPST